MTQSAKVILASEHLYGGPPIITMQLRYPKFIHSELMTHRMFSRNASSSRAIPVERLIQDVIDDPAVPIHWGRNQPGMQAHEEWDADVRLPDGCVDDLHRRPWYGSKLRAWLAYRDEAVKAARAFNEAGYHKQIVNRLIEPFCHINVIVTSTEWDNFFALRCHPDAQPEMRDLAEKMREAFEGCIPQRLASGDWHTPYVSSQDHDAIVKWMSEDPFKLEHTVAQAACRVSAARCARVSYLTHEGKAPDIGVDLALFDRLSKAEPMHASPMEHQAIPDEQHGLPRHIFSSWRRPDLHGNFIGWIQHRKLLEAGL